MSNSTLPVPTGLTLAEKVLEQIRISDHALTKAASAEAQQTELQKKTAALIPKVVETMVKFDRIDPNETEKLAAALKDPVRILELMIKVAGHRSKEELGRLGTAVHEKTASANNGQFGYNPAQSLTDPNVGARTTRLKQSSVALFEGLGMSAPTE